MKFLSQAFKRIFGSRNQRLIKQLQKTADQINELESQISSLSDDQLKAKTIEFKQRLSDGATLDELLPEAFAVVRETARRQVNMRHFDVQLIGGMVLHSGKIAEMHTGEGKTLVATLPAYLNALASQSVHIITVNDYLATRDAGWMGPIYTALGLTVGVVRSEMTKQDKQAAYASDIVYGTNNEFGFDYLRDNMAFAKEDKTQGALNFAIIDEVDSILIDEARTPLIISGPGEDSSELYRKMNQLIPQLVKEMGEQEGETPSEADYLVDEKARQAFLTEVGHGKVEQLLVQAGLLKDSGSLYSSSSIGLLHHVNAALRAHSLFTRDIDYIVRNDEVIIVDEHTGRTMPGRRWSDGLHQAVEAKEGVTIRQENHTLAAITFQNYFRLYEKLSGMTGTADTEAYEFHQIYGLEVVVVPTNQDNQRDDQPDLIFLSAKDKCAAIIQDIKACLAKQQPVLVGTASIESSEHLSGLLKKEKIEHSVLNAKFHKQEASVIAQAGRPGALTLATNMAGRGTDIVLGGNLDAEIAALDDPSEAQIAQLKEDWQQRHKKVIDAGGLHVLGSERHESRRIDNQLRGRSGRQGDPGSTRFYLSLDDNLMRIFASPTLAKVMQRLGMEKGEAIESAMVTKAIENAQRKVEGRNFDIRKQLLEYDDVANEQRKVIYQQRKDLMDLDDLSENIVTLRRDVLQSVFDQHVPLNSIEEQWDIKGLEKVLANDFAFAENLSERLDKDESLNRETLAEYIIGHVAQTYQSKAERVDKGMLSRFEKAVMLQVLDSHWKEHLAAMDYLRQSINLRGYAQKDPKQEYKREAFLLFTELLEKIKYEVISILSKFQVKEQADVDAIQEKRRQEQAQKVSYQHASVNTLAGSTEVDSPAEIEKVPAQQDKHAPFVRSHRKIGRNDPCYCGSGKKYKQCHGRLS